MQLPAAVLFNLRDKSYLGVKIIHWYLLTTAVKGITQDSLYGHTYLYQQAYYGIVQCKLFGLLARA